MEAHYLMMILTAVVLLLLFIFTRNIGFDNLVVMVPISIVFLRDVSSGSVKKNWVYFWIFFSFLLVYSRVLSLFKFFGLVKVIICYYFAFLDKENYLEFAFLYVVNGWKQLVEKYFCLINKKSD